MAARSAYVILAALCASVCWSGNAGAQGSITFEHPERPVDVPPGGYAPPPMEFMEGMPEPRFVQPTTDVGPGIGGVFFHAEYLYLKPRRRSMDFAIVDPIDQAAEIPEGSIESLDWDRRSGVRVGAGYAMPNSVWDVGAYYTYFHSTDSRALTPPPGGTLLATQTRPGAVDEVSAAAAQSNIDYDVLDFELGARVHDSGFTTIRMFGGMRAAWIDQKFTAFYDGDTAVESAVDMPLLFDGYGLRFGGEGRWSLGWGFSFFTRASGSMLIGDFRTRVTETNSAGAVLITDVGERFEKVIPVVDAGLGVSWQHNNLRASVGYEIANWFGMVESKDFVDDWHESRVSTRSSDLSLSGFFFQLGIVR